MKKLFAVVLVLALMVGLTACGGSSVAADTPTDAANTFLKAIQEQDTATLEKIYLGDAKEMDLIGDAELESASFPAELSELLSEKMQGFTFEVSNEQVEDETATVDVTVHTANIGKAFEDSINEFLESALSGELGDVTEEEMTTQLYAKFQEKLGAAEADYDGTAVLNLTKQDGGWRVDKLSEGDPLINCLTGGLLEYSESMGGDDSGEADAGADDTAAE